MPGQPACVDGPGVHLFLRNAVWGLEEEGCLSWSCDRKIRGVSTNLK